MARSSPKFRRRELSRVRQMAGLPGLAGSSPKFRRRELSRVHQMAGLPGLLPGVPAYLKMMWRKMKTW